MFSFTTPDTTVLLAASGQVTGVAARLIEHALGVEAMHYYRSPERCYPLRHRGSYFSVSHTADITAVAVATTPVGVDIEQRLPRDAAGDLAWVLTEHELSELAHGDSDSLTEIWTTKEASVKALGVGLGPNPRRIDTRPVPRVPGLRTSELPLSRSGPRQVLTYGFWLGDHHLRLAWPIPTDSDTTLSA